MKFEVGKEYDTIGQGKVIIDRIDPLGTGYCVYGRTDDDVLRSWSLEGFHHGKSSSKLNLATRLTRAMESSQSPPSESRANRFNTGKIDYTITPTDALAEEAKVWMMGEKKYGRNNWEKLWSTDTVNIVLASALRHMTAIQNGESHDPESGLQHAAHVRCNMAMIIRYFRQAEAAESSSDDSET